MIILADLSKLTCCYYYVKRENYPETPRLLFYPHTDPYLGRPSEVRIKGKGLSYCWRQEWAKRQG